MNTEKIVEACIDEIDRAVVGGDLNYSKAADAVREAIKKARDEDCQMVLDWKASTRKPWQSMAGIACRAVPK